jgi:hypothetical protein
MQGEMGCFGHSYPAKHCLKLGTGLEAPHRGVAGMWRISKDQKPVSLGLPDPRELDSQALAALGTASIDHCAATASLHANQKTMGACTADFGGLVSAFHVNFLTGSVGIRTPPHKGNQARMSVYRPEHNQGNPALSQIF